MERKVQKDMKVTDLKEAVNNINMNHEMQEQIIKNIKKQTGRKHPGSPTRHWQKTAAAAIVIAVLGIAAFPVRAFVSSLIKERMEQMPEREIVSIAENVENQTEEADSYTRDYTAAEEERYQNLYQKYKNGTFPENEIPQVDSEEAAGAYEFCYLTTAGRFCLPERELTDEELLEIIDFILKRDYAFTQTYEKEHAEEIERKKEQEKEDIAANVDNGGITEQQAIETASALLPEFYGITGEGMEFNHYYEVGDESSAPPAEPYYCVNWCDIINHQYYYFFISAKSGELTYASHSSSAIADAKGVTLETAENRISSLQQQAESFMKEKRKMDYKEEYVYYLTYDDGTTTKYARFIFEKEDGSACEVSYLWDGTFTGCKKTFLTDYENEKIIPQSAGAEQKEAKAIFRSVSAG